MSDIYIIDHRSLREREGLNPQKVPEMFLLLFRSPYLSPAAERYLMNKMLIKLLKPTQESSESSEKHT